MATFYVKSRVIHPVEITTVEAETREEAVQKTVDAADEGDQVEVLQVKEEPFDEAAGATGATGAVMRATGPAGRSSGSVSGGPAALEAKPTRAQLNEMSKDELVATAAQEGAEVNHSWNKDAIVEAILKHRRA